VFYQAAVVWGIVSTLLLFRASKKPTVAESLEVGVLRSQSGFLLFLAGIYLLYRVWVIGLVLVVLWLIAGIFGNSFTAFRKGVTPSQNDDVLDHDTGFALAKSAFGIGFLSAVGYFFCFRHGGFSILVSILFGWVIAAMQYFILSVVVTNSVRRRFRQVSSTQVAPSTQATTPKAVALPSDPAAVASLRQNLKLKVGYDEAKIDRLIALEKQKMPNAPLHTLMQAAIERWERDNR
jgi:hypothetical protein